MASPSVAVVYLVRAAEGVEPVQRFLAACAAHPAGHEHELVLVYKGFPDHQVPEETTSLFAALPVRTRSFFVDDEGYDLTAYFRVRDAFEYDYFFFMNTFSRPQAEGWLRIIMTHLVRPEVGLAGCTGSWQALGLKRFPVFPNHHIRTNAFGLSREVLRRIRFDVIRVKMDAYRFESGDEGMTAQVAAMGLHTVLTGRDGIAYQPDDWWRSGTFCQDEQENLLVADNQTESYLNAGIAFRQYISIATWGSQSCLSGVKLEESYLPPDLPATGDPDGSVTREILEVRQEAKRRTQETEALRMAEKARLKAVQARDKIAAATLKKKRRDRDRKASRPGIKGALYRLVLRFTPER